MIFEDDFDDTLGCYTRFWPLFGRKYPVPVKSGYGKHCCGVAVYISFSSG
jgi:hypothetical protein